MKLSENFDSASLVLGAIDKAKINNAKIKSVEVQLI